MNIKKNIMYGSTAVIIIALSLAFTALSLTGCDNVNNLTKSKLTGNVTLDNNSPKVGETITATYGSDGNGTGVETWQWFRTDGSDVLISDENTGSYVVTTEDVGKKIRVKVSFADQTGSVSAITTNAVTDATPKINDITYEVEQTGGTDETDDSTGIVFTFSESVDSLGLTADDIDVTDNAEKGVGATLTGEGKIRTLSPITVSEAGDATVKITKPGIAAGPQLVTVYKVGEPVPVLTSITAVYNGTATIYTTTPVNNLKGNLTVTAKYDKGSDKTLNAGDYNLSGNLTVGESTITVTYQGKEDTFKVTVISIITKAEIEITAPVNGIAPSTTATGTGNFTIGTVSWSPADNPFKGGEQYTATVTLTANQYHTFTSELSPSTVNGAPATVSNNTGAAVTLSYTFVETDTRTATALAIKTQPTKRTYTHGDELDLDGLEVTLTFDDDSSDNVTVADFAEHNITATPSNGDNLVRSTHDSHGVTVTYGELSQETDKLTVGKADPTVTWPTATAITYGAVLSTSELTGGVGEGAFAWTNGTTIPTVTNSGYEVTFTPTEAENYNTLTHNVSITVNKANPVVTTWPTATAITSGEALSTSDLTGGVGEGSFAWTDGTVIPTVTNNGYEVTFTPTDTANYNTVTHNVSITVNEVPPSVTVSFNTNGGSSISDQTITTAGDKAIRPTNPTRNSYTFDYWYTDAEFTTPYDFDTSVTSSITLYARWVSQADITAMTALNMVFVPGGTFEMGKNLGTATGADVTPLHMVTLSGFWMRKYEVTQLQWQTIMGVNPSSFINSPASGETQNRRPVERVTWYDALEFCNKLSANEGLEEVYTITGRTPASGYPITGATVTVDWSKNGYRLPTEAQWEYAAKGGDPAAAGWTGYTYAGGDTPANVAWYSVGSNDRTHEVGKKTANKLGLFDMSGNVREWCWDWYASYSSEAQINPTGASSGTYRVYRGGSWGVSAGWVRSAYRDSYFPFERDTDAGLRIARNVTNGE